MKGLMKLLILLAVIFIISSIFKGGDYIRMIGNKTGMNLHSVADKADSIRLDRFMNEKTREQRDREKALDN